MKIVIDGAGDVGSHLARLLTNEEQDILIIDSDPVKLDVLDSRYNLMTIEGIPTSFDTLRQAEVQNCDLFIAVLSSESDNIMACSMAKSLGARRTVARIESYGFMEEQNREFVRKMGVDNLIYPEFLAAQQIATALARPWVRHWFEILNGEIIVVGVRLGANAQLCDMRLRDFTSTNHDFHVSAIRRHQETIIPRGDDIMLPDDILYITTTPENVGLLLNLTGKKETKIKRVLIVGGGKIAVRLINLAQNDYKFTVIESSLDKCNRLPNKCDCEIKIYQGDGRDIETLSDVGIDDFDAFVALTGSSEANILSCLSAKEAGVKKTIAEVEDLQYVSQAESLYIGSVINKQLLASAAIFQLLLDNDSSTSKCLALTDAEVAELEVKEGSKITRAPIKNLKLDRDMTLAGLIRDGHGMLVGGNTIIQPGDHVVVFCLAGAIHKVEKLFN